MKPTKNESALHLIQEFFSGQWHTLESFEDYGLAEKELINLSDRGMFRLINQSKLKGQ